ncbi:MAG: superoxide dismutase [Alphaproteobacteria bacterium]|nr:superoxide dismutase [Alphaproteobacteria bacterium]
MSYRVAPLDITPAELEGLSERLIVSHYENNYGGAVRRLNAIAADLAKLDPATAPNFVLNGLKREELIAANSMILHELYFANLGGRSDPPAAMAAALERDFGSVARWRAEFTSMGKALGGGSGWVLLAWSPRDRRLINQWAADHTHALAGARPILALDMYEHAYQLDFGARAAVYVDTFMRNIDWVAVERRHQVAIGMAAEPAHGDPGDMAPEALGAALAAGQAPIVLDVRRRKAFDAGNDMITGAAWRQPETVAEWAGSVPRDREVVVYCVYGHNVSHDTVKALREAGVKARALAGGIAAWHAIGGPVAAKAG